jgi:transposase
VWTCKRVAEAIRRTFGVVYHPAHVNRLLHGLQHSVQRPATRATQRDEAAIAAWWQERWPALEKKRPTKGAPLSG